MWTSGTQRQVGEDARVIARLAEGMWVSRAMGRGEFHEVSALGWVRLLSPGLTFSIQLSFVWPVSQEGAVACLKVLLRTE